MIFQSTAGKRLLRKLPRTQHRDTSSISFGTRQGRSAKREGIKIRGNLNLR